MRCEIGTTNALRCQVPVLLKVPYNWSQKPRKMAIIITRRRKWTWEGVPMATWCTQWFCRMRGGLGPCIFIILALLSLPPMRVAAVGRSPTILQNDSLHQNLQFCQIFNLSKQWCRWWLCESQQPESSCMKTWKVEATERNETPIEAENKSGSWRKWRH